MGWGQIIGTAAGAYLGGPAGASLGGSLGGMLDGDSGGGAANSAAGRTGAATDRSVALQERMYKEGVARQKPFYKAGVNALGKMQAQYNNMPAAFSGNVDLTQDPGYAFRLSEGQKALERSAAARGGLLSGGTGKALARFGQDYGSQEYGNAYNRALTQYNAAVNRENTGYNRLAAMSGTGQTAANTLGSAGQNYASNVGNAYINQGVNEGNALLAGQQARQSSYGDLAEAAGKFYENYRGGSGTSGRWNPATGTFG